MYTYIMFPVLFAIVMYYRKFHPPPPPEDVDVDYYRDTTKVIDYSSAPEEEFELISNGT